MNTAFDQQPATRLPAQSATRKGLFALYCGVSLFAIFYLPYFFPVAPSTSDSYIFGYNNTVGLLLLMLFVSVGAIWTKGLNFNFNPTGPSPKVPLKYLWLSLAVEFAACAGMYLATIRYGSLGEAEYHIGRILLLSQGKQPYIDFEWTFGKGFLYVPKLLASILHLSIPDAYFLFWIAVSLLSIVLLYAVVNLIDFPSGRRTPIFLVYACAAVFCVPDMGVHYALFRYVCPLFFILVIHRVNQSTGAKFRILILAVTFAATLLLISPEVTIAFAFACTLTVWPSSFKVAEAGRIWTFLATLTGIAGIFLYGYKSHIFDVVLEKRHGTESFPFVFAPAILMFFAAVFVCGCYLVQRAARVEIRDNTFALILFSIPMMVAALGRCDPAHVLLNGIGFFIAVFFYASASERMWVLYCRSFVGCFLVIAPIFGIIALALRFAAAPPPPFPQGASIHSLYPSISNPGADGIFEAPFGFRPIAKGFYFSPEIDDGYYDSLFDASSPDAYRKKISELAQHPERDLLLHQDIFGVCQVHERIERASVSILFDFPYTASVVHRESIREPLCDYIRQHYTLAVPASPQNFQYELWKPKM